MKARLTVYEAVWFGWRGPAPRDCLRPTFPGWITTLTVTVSYSDALVAVCQAVQRRVSRVRYADFTLSPTELG
jgi:hypothetical protein